MSEITRISAREARERVAAGQALLVCAYASEEKFARHHLDGAIALADLEARCDQLPREQEIIFYCN